MCELSALPQDCQLLDARNSLFHSQVSHLAMGYYLVDIQLVLSKLVNGAISVFTFSTFGSIPLISLKFKISNHTFF